MNDLSKTNDFIKILFKNTLSRNILPIIKYSLNKNHLTTNILTEKEYQISEIIYDSNGNLIIIDTDSISTYNIGGKIEYKLKSINEIGSSDYSSLLTITLSSLSNPLLNWKYKIISKTSVSISWDIYTQISNIPILGYVIYIYFNSIIENTITTTGIECTLKNLFPGKEYTIHLKSINALGESETKK